MVKRGRQFESIPQGRPPAEGLVATRESPLIAWRRKTWDLVSGPGCRAPLILVNEK